MIFTHAHFCPICWCLSHSLAIVNFIWCLYESDVWSTLTYVTYLLWLRIIPKKMLTLRIHRRGTEQPFLIHSLSWATGSHWELWDWQRSGTCGENIKKLRNAKLNVNKRWRHVINVSKCGKIGDDCIIKHN